MSEASVSVPEPIAANVVRELHDIASDIYWSMNCRENAVRLVQIADDIEQAMEDR